MLPLSRLASAFPLVVIILSTALAGAQPEPRAVVELAANWTFALQPKATAIETPSFDDAAWERVTLPHTWNARDGQDGGNYARGDGWYRIRFGTSAEWKGRRVFLEVDAANKVTDVWLNGQAIGKHEGGYARFRFDVTGALAEGRENVLVLRVNNEQGSIIPIHGDFTHFGGLYRGVRLVAVDPLHLAMNDHGSSGVFIDTRELTAERATVSIRTLIENAGATATEAQVRVTVLAPSGETVASTEVNTRVGSGQTSAVGASLQIPSPQLWNGQQAPNLYRARVSVLRDGRETDGLTETFGLRTFAFDPQRGFLLNGQPYALYGVNRHQDRLDKGYAISEADKREDMAIMEEMGVTSVRLCHYQHDRFFYSLCDERGMVVWPELAFVGSMVENNPAFDANAAQQLRELIRQNYNHPSIVCWSVGNETRIEQVDSCTKLLTQLAAVVKAEDPYRPSTYASHHSQDDPRNVATDIVAFNKYFGWYRGKYPQLGVFLDEFHAKHPDRAIGVSEYGAGASVFQQEQNAPSRPTTQSKGPWHPEQWQSTYHEESWLVLKDRPYLWGTYIWVMFDFASDNRNEGDTAGRNDKGLVTADRRTRKDAFFWYKANWTKEPMVYITSRRDVLRLEPKTDVKLYSNCESVELWVNGVSLGKKTSSDRRFVWKDVSLVSGPNRIFAEGERDGHHVADSCAWTYSAGGTYRPAAEPEGSDSAPVPAPAPVPAK